MIASLRRAKDAIVRLIEVTTVGHFKSRVFIAIASDDATVEDVLDLTALPRINDADQGNPEWVCAKVTAKPMGGNRWQIEAAYEPWWIALTTQTIDVGM